MYGYFVIGRGRPLSAILIGSGDEMKELYNEINNNPIYDLKFVSSVDLNRSDEKGFWDEIVSYIYSEEVSIIAIDLANKGVVVTKKQAERLLGAVADYAELSGR